MGTTKSKPPGPIITIDQSEILSRSQIQFITFFFRGALYCAFYQPRQAAQIWWRKTNFLAKPAHFDFFTVNFTVWSHILSIGGDALRNQKIILTKPFHFGTNMSKETRKQVI
jgi:hypothetical protein